MDKKKIIVLFFLGPVLLGVIFIPNYLKIRGLTKLLREQERQMEELREANRGLKEEQEKLQSDPVYLEKVAREKLGVAREGEIVYKVLSPQQNR